MRAKLFVGNLNYESSVDRLEAVFRPFQGYLHTKICYERHTGKSLGYAVVHFDNPAAAQYAIDVLHNAKVDGRHIVVAPYRPRVSEASGPNPSPRPLPRPASNESVALVMDLNKNATWMDLKDIMSQRSKVLFVDEPRMIRTAFVHFASEEDREQARVALRNTQVLGSTIDVVPIGMDSVLLGSDHSSVDKGPPEHRHPHPLQEGHAQAPHMPLNPSVQAMLPVAYMTPAMGPIQPPCMGMDQSYQMQRPHMWQPPPMQPFVPQYTMPSVMMPSPGAPTKANTVNATAPTSAPPPGMSAGPGTPISAQTYPGGTGGHSPGMHSYPGNASGGYSAAQPASSGGTAAAAAQRNTEGLSSEGSASFSPGLQQLVRQLTMQQLGGHQDMPSSEDH